MAVLAPFSTVTAGQGLLGRPVDIRAVDGVSLTVERGATLDDAALPLPRLWPPPLNDAADRRFFFAGCRPGGLTINMPPFLPMPGPPRGGGMYTPAMLVILISQSINHGRCAHETAAFDVWHAVSPARHLPFAAVSEWVGGLEIAL